MARELVGRIIFLRAPVCEWGWCGDEVGGEVGGEVGDEVGVGMVWGWCEDDM